MVRDGGYWKGHLEAAAGAQTQRGEMLCLHLERFSRQHVWGALRARRRAGQEGESRYGL